MKRMEQADELAAAAGQLLSALGTAQVGADVNGAYQRLLAAVKSWRSTPEAVAECFECGQDVPVPELCARCGHSRVVHDSPYIRQTHEFVPGSAS